MFTYIHSLRLKKTAVIVEIFQFSFRVFACAFPTMISSIFGKSFPFPFPYFVLTISFVLQDHILPNMTGIVILALT